MFAIFASSLLKGKMGYCGVPDGDSYYGWNQADVSNIDMSTNQCCVVRELRTMSGLAT